MRYDVKRPCSNCPFRSDRFFPLHPDRIQEIADDLTGIFPCHKTVDYGDNGGTVTDETRACAGFLLVHERQGTTTNLMRIMERFGVYRPGELDMNAPVYGSFAEYRDAADRRGIKRCGGL